MSRHRRGLNVGVGIITNAVTLWSSYEKNCKKPQNPVLILKTLIAGRGGQRAKGGFG